MYDLTNFIPFDGIIRNGEHKVLVWSKQTGYYFTQFGFVMLNNNFKLIAKEI